MGSNNNLFFSIRDGQSWGSFWSSGVLYRSSNNQTFVFYNGSFIQLIRKIHMKKGSMTKSLYCAIHPTVRPKLLSHFQASQQIPAQLLVLSEPSSVSQWLNLFWGGEVIFARWQSRSYFLSNVTVCYELPSFENPMIIPLPIHLLFWNPPNLTPVFDLLAQE